MVNQEQKPNLLWVLLPIFLGIIGGIIGYFLLKNKDRKFAKQILLIGIAVTIIIVLFTIISSFYIQSWASQFIEIKINEAENKIPEVIRQIK